MESIRILTYYRAWCRLGRPSRVQKGTFHMSAGAIRSPLHGPLCLMVTKVLVAAKCVLLVTNVSCSHPCDLRAIVLDAS